MRRLRLCWNSPEVLANTNHDPELEDYDFVSRFINKPIEKVEGMREFVMLVLGACVQIGLRILYAFAFYIRTFPTKVFELVSLPFSYLAIIYWFRIIVQSKTGPLAKPILIGSLTPQEELDLHVAAYKYAQSLDIYQTLQSK